MKDKRIINIRVLFCSFIGLMIGILISYFFVVKNMSLVGSLLISFLVLLCCVSIFVYSLVIKDKSQLSFNRKYIPRALKISSISVVLFFVVGIVLGAVQLSKISSYSKNNDDVVVIGTVCDYIVVDDNNKSFVINNVNLIVNDDCYSIDCKIDVRGYIYNDINLGDNVIINGSLKNYVIDDGYGFSRLIENVGYSIYVKSGDISVTSGNKIIKDIIKDRVKYNLDNTLNEDNSAIAYAMLFGDKSYLNNSTKDMFSYVGISHTLAVSGLHVGVLCGVILFLLNKIKMNKFLRLGIFSLILLGYCYICSFSVSVVRASIMAIIYLLSKILYKEYDSISSLSLAGILILLFKPLALFSISFQLSFLSVFSIITFAPDITKLLTKIKCPQKLSSALAISICTNLVILPVCLNVFSTVSLIGIIANILILPIFSIMFVLLFGSVILSFILPFMSFILHIPNLFLHIIKVIANYFAKIPFGCFRACNVSYWILILIMTICLTVHYLMINKKIKLSIIGLLSIVLIVVFVCNIIPTNYRSNNIIIGTQYDSNVVFVINDNNVTMIGSDITQSRLDSIQKYYKFYHIDSIIAYDLQLNNICEFVEICNKNRVKSIYINNSLQYNEIENIIINGQFFDTDINCNDIIYNFIKYDDKLVGINFDISGIGSVMLQSKTNNYVMNKYLIDNFNFDLLIVAKNSNLFDNIDNVYLFDNNAWVRSI